MDRTFDLTLDIQKPVDPQNSFRFFRGDNVVFNFVYKNGDEDFSTSDAAKLRVYAKRVYARGVSPDEQPLFAEETTTVSTVSFNSSSTAGDAGNYLMAVILLDANNNLITAQGIYFDLIENGYAGIYQPGEEFRDEVLDALAQAQAAATNSANSATEAEGYKTSAAESAGAASGSASAAAQSETNAASSASSAQASATAASQSESNALASKNAAEDAAQIAQETDAGGLMLSKMGAGQLWFNRGKLSGSNFPIPTFPFSICAQVRIDGWKGASDVSQSIFQCGTYGSTQLVSLGFSDTSSFPRLGVQVSSTSDGTTTSSAFRCNFDYSDFIGKDHTIVAVCRNLDSSDTLDWSIYLDGEAMTGSPTKDLKIDALGGSVNYAVNTTNGNFPSNAACANPMRLSRLAVFNFDMSAEGAPYTVADYVSGKLVPPALYDPAAAQRAMLALEDYSIAVGATRYVPDVSGNAYDATVVESGGSGDTAWTGTVKGSRDTAIKRLCDLINANNQSA